jgi:hypothetical protein
MEDHPPVLQNPNKKIVFGITCPPGSSHGGRIIYTRWRAMRLPDSTVPDRIIGSAIRREGFFDYLPILDQVGAVEWHVNFADPDLFMGYGTPLFAQDEMQVAEHPILGALREALEAEGATTLTKEGGEPTPVLVSGAERRCIVATDVDPARGRPHGLYGIHFAAASADAVRKATTRLDPPSVSNLIAMAAPAYGSGRYSADQIEHVLTTAYTGFRTAVIESGAGPVAVHTGFWGCGAFGGDRVLMTMLQVIASGLAGVERLVFHTSGEAGSAAFDSAVHLLEKELAGPSASPRELIRRIAEMGFRWGTSDGN